MLRHLTSFCIVLCLSAAPATTRADDNPVPAAATTNRADHNLPAVSPEIRQFKGKLVRIYHDVNLLGTGKPSSLHTEYLIMLLQQAGATVVSSRSLEKIPAEKNPAAKNPAAKSPDVIIFGDIAAPPPLDPAEAADPFTAAVAKRRRQEIEKYNQARPTLEQDAVAAGSRVINSADVAAALGIRVAGEAQIVKGLDARARESLELVLPLFKADAMSLRDIVDFLRDATGANIFVNWRALEAAGVDRNAPLTLNIGQTPLSEALDKLLSHAAATARAGKGAKLDYAVQEGVIVISTDDDVKKRNQ